METVQVFALHKYRIIRRWDDHDPVTLGHVSSPSEFRDWDRLWEEFNTTHPLTNTDCDVEFIDFLVEKGFTKIEDEFEDVVVEGY